MKTKIFISRELGPKSPFRKKNDARRVQIIDQSLISFSSIEFVDIESEWIFFYSKTGVDYYLAQKNQIEHTNIATFGPATAKYYARKAGRVVNFIGSGERNDVAEKFKLESGYESCLFVVGENSFRSVQNILSSKTHQEIIVYNNTPKSHFEIEEPALAVFTSPMAVKTYFSKYTNRSHPNFAIGSSTAESIKDIGQQLTAIADVPSESSLADAVNSYLSQL